MISKHELNLFLETIWDYYHVHGRHDLPWRRSEVDGSFDPYKIMVSEIMLQQTQVPRVIPKYEEFLDRFKNIQALAAADLGDVLRVWQGLGYNRRAKFLWQAAHNLNVLGAFPDTQLELVKLPGIGSNTAGAILAYACNLPTVFIETNIRTVYIHHFFGDCIDVDDKEIRTLLEETMDRENPREFYWALMDYGSNLKATLGNLNKASKHYKKQSSFKGSRRQVRGAVLKALGDHAQSLAKLQQIIPDDRLESVLDDLSTEGLIRASGGEFSL